VLTKGIRLVLVILHGGAGSSGDWYNPDFYNKDSPMYGYTYADHVRDNAEAGFDPLGNKL
jgi:pimeloyl-ACP methyl ester carboxylesterase